MEDFSNQDTHIYDDEIIIRVLNDIFERYFFLLQDFYVSFKAVQSSKICFRLLTAQPQSVILVFERSRT